MGVFLKKILWVTDFSDEAQEAFVYAKHFAKTFNAKLIALHVVPDFSSTLYNTTAVIKTELTKRLTMMKKEAERKLTVLQKKQRFEFKSLVLEGNASKKIIETSEKKKVDLIIMGKRGVSAVEKLFIGSVANQVLRNSTVPILLTKKRTGKPAFKKILVPTDFSKQEEVERDFAWKLAKGLDSDLTLLHVLELHDYEFSPRVLDDMLNSVLKRLKRRKATEKEDIRVTEDVYRAINASLGVVDYAETQKFDMIVISTCVHSKLERFFLGSTTEKVISYSSIPIFAIPPAHCLK
jgi:nucleotide-binding universal stress UspA family protein